LIGDIAEQLVKNVIDNALSFYHFQTGHINIKVMEAGVRAVRVIPS
jgi:hypothetical protein